MKYRMLPRARSWVGLHAPALCVVRECAGVSLETGSFKTRLGPSGPRARTERTCLTCVLNWSVYWDCVLVVCPTWIRVSGSLLCVWRALPTELCVTEPCVPTPGVFCQVFGRKKAGWQRWVVSIVGNVRNFHVNTMSGLWWCMVGCPICRDPVVFFLSKVKKMKKEKINQRIGSDKTSFSVTLILRNPKILDNNTYVNTSVVFCIYRIVFTRIGVDYIVGLKFRAKYPFLNKQIT